MKELRKRKRPLSGTTSVVSLSGQTDFSGEHLEKCPKLVWKEFLDNALPLISYVNTKICM
jgi:hypothetical protein